MKKHLLLAIVTGFLSACATHPANQPDQDLESDLMQHDAQPPAALAGSAGKSHLQNKRAPASVPGKEKGFGVSFRPQGHKLVVENLNGKLLSQLNVGDQVLLIDGKKPRSTQHAKSILLNAAGSKKKWVRMDILRDGKERTIFEPVSVKR
jgi:hypothetical protein